MSIVAGWPETWSAEQDKRRKYGTKFAVIPCKEGHRRAGFYCCAAFSYIKRLVLKGHLYNAGDRSVPACITVFVVILTLEATSAKALAVPLPKVCCDPSPLVHMALWGSARMPMHWALGHLGTTPATRVRIDTSWLCTSSLWTDAKSYRRVLSARHQ